LGLCREYVFVDHEPSYTILADRVRFPAWGLFGGRSGKPARYILIGDNGETDLPSKATVQLEAGQSVRLESCGGGGYGSPYERDPEQVLADVRQEKISPLRARDEYGVVIAGNAIDGVETERLRTRMKERA
jgi:N-methylhydantoinase B